MNGNHKSNNNVIVRNTISDYLGNLAGDSECAEQPPKKCQKIIHGYALPQIAIKQEPPETSAKTYCEVVLVNGCWDTSDQIPNIVAEMQSVEDVKPSGALMQYGFGGGDGPDLFFNPSPRGSDSGIESDCTDANLSWLLNYKIHELPPVPDVTSTLSETMGLFNNAPSSNHNNVEPIARNEQEMVQNDLNNRMKSAVPDKPQSPNKGVSAYRQGGPKKPPFTYTELIEHALSEKGELTVSGIYQWISDHFPFYQQNDDRWKNSVRHNLSINPHFRKGSKAVHGAGHLWTIAQKDDKKTWQIKQRMQQFIQANSKDSNGQQQQQEALDMELQAATASILGESFTSFPSLDQTKKEHVEVEFVNVVDIQNGLEDFLSPPVPKQQIAQECGLGSDFLITDLNPSALGINLAEGEVINDGHFYDDISFEYYELEHE